MAKESSSELAEKFYDKIVSLYDEEFNFQSINDKK